MIARVRIIWSDTPPTPEQWAAWDRLWARLLSPVDPGSETPQPQESPPGAEHSPAAVGTGHAISRSAYIEDSTHPPSGR
jgi:hypothetical protein